MITSKEQNAYDFRLYSVSGNKIYYQKLNRQTEIIQFLILIDFNMVLFSNKSLKEFQFIRVVHITRVLANEGKVTPSKLF